MPPSKPASRRVSLVTLGCVRNEVDSEELAGQLAAQGWQVGAPESADVLVVNTCGFIEAAKKDSVDTLLSAADSGKKVVAVGCLAERYGSELAESLPEADAVLGFDAYPHIADRLDDVLAGRRLSAHRPRDRRTLLPITPVARPAAAAGVPIPGHGWGPRVVRQRLDDSPVAPLKLASGCDRRCAFCAIPTFRGAFVSRPPQEVLAEARWLAEHGVRELVLVSENSTSYGKDLGDLRLLETLLPELAGVTGIVRVRLTYLQPAEVRPSLLTAIASTPGVAAYLDMSFQHSSAAVLRRMRRFGSTERFLALLDQVRELRPDAGVRSNVIVGFPAETRSDVTELERFLQAARMDAVGVFGYSDEDGTEAAGYDHKLRPGTIARRVDRLTRLVEELSAQRAEERVGSTVEVLIESAAADAPSGVRPDLAPDAAGGSAEGRAEHQAPEVDGCTLVTGGPELRVGDLVQARVVGSAGVDLVAEYLQTLSPAGGGAAAGRLTGWRPSPAGQVRL